MKKSRSRLFTNVFFGIILLCCIAYLGSYYYDGYQSSELNHSLAETVDSAKTPIDSSLLAPPTQTQKPFDYYEMPTAAPTIVPDIEDVEEEENFVLSEEMMNVLKPSETDDDNDKREVLSMYKELYEQNKDMVGWLKVDDTAINYPVMFKPGQNNYYIRRGFNKKHSNAGSLFIDERSKVLKKRSTNLIIYGHNMRNGSMFHDLLNYAEESFYLTHPTIQFNTIYEEATYDIVAAFYSKVLFTNEEGFRYYEYIDFSKKKEFNEYIKTIRNLSEYDTGIKVSYGDQLITLSTCSYHEENGRFVVVARKRS